MEKLEKIIYKFLDTYVGEGIGDISLRDNAYNPNDGRFSQTVFVRSRKNVLIFVITIPHARPENEVIIDGDISLLGMMCDYFSLDFLQVQEVLLSWFCKIYNIKNKFDFLRFIEYEYERRKIGL